MDFATLRQKLDSPASHALLNHWCAARGTRLMPAWADIQPKALARFLPMVWAVKYDAEQAAYIVRIAGEDVSHVLGGVKRGTSVTDFLSPPVAAVVLEHYERVRLGPAILLRRGPVPGTIGAPRNGERVGFPLSADGVTVDGIIGTADLQMPATHVDTVLLPERVAADRIDFFPVPPPQQA